ncbi:DUF899 family protein [Flindersiella endophytica]
MNDSTASYPLPEIVDRTAWQAELDKLLVREKAHTREGDAIAAARRRLPMVEVDRGSSWSERTARCRSSRCSRAGGS